MNNPIDANSESELQGKIDERLKTAYEIARAATATEEGRKAIDFFYHVHLNSYPGFAADIIHQQLEAKIAEAQLVTAVQIHDNYWHSQRTVAEQGIGPVALARKQKAEEALAHLTNNTKGEPHGGSE